jgi:O-antigen/teichoic acid export membrane protein
VKSTRLALAWSLSERYVSLLVTLASSMVIARLLTPAEIGKFSLCAAVLAVAATLRDFGISEYLIQARTLDRSRQRSAFTVTLGVAWSVGGLLYLLRHQLAAFYDEPELAQIVAVLALNFALVPLATGAFALLNRELAFRRIFVLQSSASVVQAVTGVALAATGHGALSLAWASVAGAALQVLLLLVYRPQAVLLWPGLANIGEVLRYGLLAVAGRLVDTATGNAHEFIIARQFDFASVGLFSRALGLVEMFSKNITAAISRVAMPSMAQAHRDGRALTSSFARGTALFTGIAWPFFVFMGLTAPEIVRIMFGPQWDVSGQLAMWLCASMLPSSLYAFSASTLAAMGLVRKRLEISLMFGPVHVALLLLAAAQGQLWLVAAVYCVSHCVMLALQARALRQALQASTAELFSACSRSAWLALGLAAVLAAGVALLRSLEAGPVAVLLGAIALGLPAWVAGVLALKHPLHGEVERLRQGLIGRLAAWRQRPGR